MAMISADIPVADEAAPIGVLRGSLFERLGLSTADVLLVSVAVLLCIAHAPFFLVPSWTPRMAVVLGVLPIGLVALAVRARALDWAAVVALALIAWSVVSGVVANEPAIALKGTLGRESSALILAASLGLWALASELTERGRVALRNVLTWSLVVCAAVGVLQVVLRITSGTIPLGFGRATGLTTHPVYFGGLMAGGCALVAFTWGHRTIGLNGFFLCLFAVGVSISGSRIALGAAVVVLGYGAACYRSGAWIGTFGIFIVGNIVGTILLRVFALDVSAEGTRSASAVDRLSVAGGGLRMRLEVWSYGLEAALERPFWGWGLGGFRSAVQDKFTPEFTRLHAATDAAPWFDAHNVIVEVGVALGVVGLILAILFGVAAARGCRGALAAASVAIAMTWLFEPASLITLPLVMMLLGASGTRRPVLSGLGSPSRRAIVALAVVTGLVVSTGLAMAELRLKRAVDSNDPRQIERAIDPFWRDPVAADLAAQAWALTALAEREQVDAAIAASERTVSYEAQRPAWWEKLASRQVLSGDVEGARESLERALELQPWRVSTWRFLHVLAGRLDDPSLTAETMSALCTLRQEECVDAP